MHNKLDTIYTTVTGILSIELFTDMSPADWASVYGFFCQSLVATAAIGKLMLDYYDKKRGKN